MFQTEVSNVIASEIRLVPFWFVFKRQKRAILLFYCFLLLLRKWAWVTCAIFILTLHWPLRLLNNEDGLFRATKNSGHVPIREETSSVFRPCYLSCLTSQTLLSTRCVKRFDRKGGGVRRYCRSRKLNSKTRSFASGEISLLKYQHHIMSDTWSGKITNQRRTENERLNCDTKSN